MTAGSSIDPAEFLYEHLAQASPDLLRELMQGFINTLLSADADSVSYTTPRDLTQSTEQKRTHMSMRGFQAGAAP